VACARFFRRCLRVAAGLAAVAGLAVVLAPDAEQTSAGRDGATLAAQREVPAVEAYFLRESYRPGSRATLVVTTKVRAVTVQVFRTGDAPIAGKRRDEMRGVPVTPRRQKHFDGREGERRISVDMGDWPSGVYYAELRAADGRLGYAPFVLAPARLGTHRVAVVLPTNTWAAYNSRDADGNGRGDTWYADPKVLTVDLTRPFLDRGVPPHFGGYDLPFVRWLAKTNKAADFLAQRDLETVASGDVLARVYDLIIFPGHHEYVTTHEYDVIERYRDLGGNLMFLSANNFYWRVAKTRDTMSRTARWRDLGRPEAALIGVQYIGNDEGEHRGPYRLRKAPASDWIFAGTSRRAGSELGSFGIEIDHTAPSSPAGTQVLAEIPDLLGPGMTGQMSYYETRRGARVFAAGAFTMSGAALWPAVSPVLENLWSRMSDDPREPAGLVGTSLLARTNDTQQATAPGYGRLTVNSVPRSENCGTAQREAAVASYGWPVKPFHRQHPVRGYFGDPRIADGGVSRSFHFGVDVSAPDGTPVFATATGSVSRHPLHNVVVVIHRADGVEFEYWHVIPTVTSGRATAYQTIIGHIEKPWAHLHFSERRGGVYVNPLRPGAMGPYADRTCPAATKLGFERDGKALGRRALHGSFEIVLEATDAPAMSAPRPWFQLPVTPALIRWRIVDQSNRGVTPWQTAFDVRERLPQAEFSTVYATGTAQNHPDRPGRYRFRLASGFSAGSLGPGAYALRVMLVDSRGNGSRASWPFSVAAAAS